MQVGRADLDDLGAELGREEAGERHFELGIGEEEHALAGEPRPVGGERGRGPAPARRGRGLEAGGIDPEGVGRRAQPAGGALRAERERGRQVVQAARFERPGGAREEGLGQQEGLAGRDRGHRPGAAPRQEADRDAEIGEEARELVLDHVAERARDQQAGLARRRLRRRKRLGQLRHQGGEAGVLALREGGLDPRARVGEHPHGREAAREPQARPREVELDHFRRAGADEEEEPDVGPPGDQPLDHPVELVLRVGEAGEIPLVEDRGGEAGLGEDHHAGRRLDQVRAGARADHEEEGVLDLAVQPDDAGEPAEHRALAALAREIDAAALGADGRVHGRPPAIWSRAARSFSRNWPALTT